MKVSELTGVLLDYWVARADGLPLSGEWNCSLAGGIFVGIGADGDLLREFEPSARWEHGGPIIERERIAFFQTFHDGHVYFSQERRWTAWTNGAMYETDVGGDAEGVGPTQLVAAMRAFVASKFGAEVEDLSP